MHILTKKRLSEFWAAHPDSEQPLRIWYGICKKTKFKNFAELKRAFGTVDKVGRFTVFDIGGNKWRLITVIHFTTGKIYILAVLTHKEYDHDHWKRE
ncbi:MAG: type II toxin-antitoxin system HigB family toxin [Methyloceanibacter sp.]